MGKTEVQKEKILIQSFEVLLNNISTNKTTFPEIIGKVSIRNVQSAVDLWKRVLEMDDDAGKDYYLTSKVISELDSRLGREKLIDILEKNEDILEACYGKAKDINTDYLWFILRERKVDLANKIYELIKKNRYKLETTAELVEQVCEWFATDFDYLKDGEEDYYERDEFEEERANKAIIVLKKWIKNIRDKEAKARIRVTLINFL